MAWRTHRLIYLVLSRQSHLSAKVIRGPLRTAGGIEAHSDIVESVDIVPDRLGGTNVRHMFVAGGGIIDGLTVVDEAFPLIHEEVAHFTDDI